MDIGLILFIQLCFCIGLGCLKVMNDTDYFPLWFFFGFFQLLVGIFDLLRWSWLPSIHRKKLTIYCIMVVAYFGLFVFAPFDPRADSFWVSGIPWIMATWQIGNGIVLFRKRQLQQN